MRYTHRTAVGVTFYENEHACRIGGLVAWCPLLVVYTSVWWICRAVYTQQYPGDVSRFAHLFRGISPIRSMVTLAEEHSKEMCIQDVSENEEKC